MIAREEIVLRLALAAVFGAVIGLERERKDWAAGLRTHMMVCLGAALAMMVSAFGFSDVIDQKNIALDPSRVAAQVISGIGFIGAGSILFLKQGIIRGLTTASGLWTVAAIGLATGGGMYFAAIITTVFAIIILWVLQPIERKFSARFKQKSIKVVAADNATSVEIVNRFLQNSEFEISNYSVYNDADGEYIIFLKFKKYNQEELMSALKEIQSDRNIKEVVWGR
ncbi:MAG: MgtC/SapB family protein [Bacteroidetes bacterium]|nr:MgtC/SapB family protein [Bacteroidota bacterium]